jgi:hypothetical protein
MIANPADVQLRLFLQQACSSFFQQDKCIFNNESRKKYNGKAENFATCVTRNAEIAIKEAA